MLSTGRTVAFDSKAISILDQVRISGQRRVVVQIASVCRGRKVVLICQITEDSVAHFAQAALRISKVSGQGTVVHPLVLVVVVRVHIAKHNTLRSKNEMVVSGFNWY